MHKAKSIAPFHFEKAVDCCQNSIHLLYRLSAKCILDKIELGRLYEV